MTCCNTTQRGEGSDMMSFETNLSSWARVLQRGRKPGRQTGRWKKVEEKEMSLPDTWLYLEEKKVAIWQVMKGNQISSLQKGKTHFSLPVQHSIPHYSYYFCSMWKVCEEDHTIFGGKHSKCSYKKAYCIVLHPTKQCAQTWSFIRRVMNKSEVLWAVNFNTTFLWLIIRSICQKLPFLHKNLQNNIYFWD